MFVPEKRVKERERERGGRGAEKKRNFELMQYKFQLFGWKTY